MRLNFVLVGKTRSDQFEGLDLQQFISIFALILTSQAVLLNMLPLSFCLLDSGLKMCLVI